MTKVKFICENCNKEFEARPQDKRGKHIFCSMECQHKWRTGKTGLVRKKGIYKICPICNKEFYCYPYQIKKRKLVLKNVNMIMKGSKEYTKEKIVIFGQVVLTVIEEKTGIRKEIKPEKEMITLVKYAEKLPMNKIIIL